jgi:hypothetical protein
MKQLLWFLAVLGLTASAASAGPNAGGVLWVHDTGVTRGSDPLDWPADPVNCPGDVVVTAPLSPDPTTAVRRYWKVYAAFPPGSSPRLKSVAWGTEFTDNVSSAYSYVNVEGGSVCNGEITPATVFFVGVGGFPTASGGSIGQSFPPGARTTLVTPLFMFWGFGYNGDASANPTWRLVETIGDANFGDDRIPVTRDPIMGYGTLGFGTPGFAPCPVHDPTTLAACCDLEGSLCEVTTQADCAGPNVWHDDLYVCDPNPCPVPTGACCLPDGRCIATPCTSPTPLCPNTTAVACAAAGGTYMGNDVSCDPMPCQMSAGACCFPDGTCEVQSQTECTGDWTLSGACVPNTCPAPDDPRACCDLQRDCRLTLQADCALPSQWHAEWSACDPNECLTLTGACCALDGTCSLTTVSTCDPSLTWRGDLTSCEPNLCPLLPTERASWGQIKNRFR